MDIKSSRRQSVPLRIAGLVIAFALSISLSAHSQTLFGDPTCKEWAAVPPGAKKDWVNKIYLLLTHDLRHREGEEKYKNLNMVDLAVVEVDKFCVLNNESRAMDGAMNYLKASVGIQ